MTISVITLLWLVLLVSKLFICSSLRPPLLSEELGCSPTLSILVDRQRFQEFDEDRSNRPLYYFDPLRVATDENFARLRECELKHGRVAMLAMLQVVSIPLLKQVDVVPTDVSESLVTTVKSMTTQDMFRVAITCAVLELIVFVQRDPSDMPGDYGTGFLGLRDKGAHEDILVVELENGRLAMIGFVGFVVSDFLTSGKPWMDQWTFLAEPWRSSVLT